MSHPGQIGKCEILEQIGLGGFSAVYKARDPSIERLVAIKVCLANGESFRERFFREAQIGGNLHHPKEQVLVPTAASFSPLFPTSSAAPAARAWQEG